MKCRTQEPDVSHMELTGSGVATKLNAVSASVSVCWTSVAAELDQQPLNYLKKFRVLIRAQCSGAQSIFKKYLPLKSECSIKHLA